ncbi:hypothetical protein J7F02_19315 [Streptomyces sp. ISL-112]|uniref:hypothetical protein n=1 Tax=unclassified Streptomyces TaxID=2593676 RepID=UPI001BEA45BC|nr:MULTISPECIES: hypothetical protein [unclassified Streptomyces]MBT2427757.1 hypothetical protein [Streptomyces sp. ISL-112]MBT2464538.1 hypothetical protein [Streptomyces sp. ISL-63]
MVVHQIPDTPHEQARVAPDTDVPVDEKRRAPPALSRQWIEHRPFPCRAAAAHRRDDGRGTHIDPEYLVAAHSQCRYEPPGPTADVRYPADAAHQH